MDEKREFAEGEGYVPHPLLWKKGNGVFGWVLLPFW